MVFSLSTLQEFFKNYQQSNPVALTIDNDGYITLTSFMTVLQEKRSYVSIANYVRQVTESGEFEINLTDEQIQMIFMLITKDIHTSNLKLVENIDQKIAKAVLGTFKTVD